MDIQAVVGRELRVQARSRGLYWLRVLTGGAAAITFGAALLLESEMIVLGGRKHGPWLFALLHTTISIVLAVACPLMSADTLARERREGTLGLLLLTPLKSGAIVMGKMAAHLVRALTLWLTVVPILAVPFLLGGVSGADIGFALALELGTVLGGLAAGLLASSFAERWGAAMGLAALFAVVVGEGLALLSFLGFCPFLLANQHRLGLETLFLVASLMPWILGSGLIENGFSGFLAQSPRWMTNGVLVGLGASVLGSVLVFTVATWLAAVRVRRIARVDARTPRQESRRRFWFKPCAARRYWRTRHSRLRRNPLLWLYTFQPGSRLGRWAWCGIVMLVWSGILLAGIDDGDTEAFVFGIPMVLVAALAFVASASFQREMETGALELLLVTPLRPMQIVRARLDALWSDFLPALSLSTVLALLWMTFHNYRPGNLLFLATVWSSFIAVPALGARFAIRRINPLVGLLWTLGLAFFLPYAFGGMAALALESPEHDEWSFALRFGLSFVTLQAVEGGASVWTTVQDLTTRRFQLRPLQRMPA